MEVLGVAPEVISGDEEAWLSFTGATRELAAGEASPPYLVTDIGGGSTEFILGGPAGVAGARSVNIGCVRLTERHLHGDPPPAAEIAATTADIDAALEPGRRRGPGRRQARTLVGLAGSVTTVGGDRARPRPSRLRRASTTPGSRAAQVHEIAGGCWAMTRAERAAIPVMHPGRVDVIGAGALILDRIMTRFGFAEVLVSEHDILDGIAWSLVPLADARRAGPPGHRLAGRPGDARDTGGA